MAIEYIEVRNENRELTGIIDTAISVIWHTVYYGVGDFEIYTQAIPEHISLLKQDYYVTRPNENTVGIIEKVHITTTDQDGDVIVASGRFAKSLLERRLIYNLSGNTNKATVLRGNVEVNVRKLVSDNAINCTYDSKRNLPVLTLGKLNNIPAIIVNENGVATEKQVSYENLLTYTDDLLKEYALGSRINFNDTTKKFEFEVYTGTDRSGSIIFSQEYDNLIQSEYVNDNSTEKNVALIGGEGEGLERFYSLLGSKQGLSRREIFVNASSLNKELKESELKELFPSGTFVGLNFVVSGTVYATLVVDLEREYTLSTLQEKFPTGTVSGAKFVVNGVTYATQIYGEENKYKLTSLGYKAMLEVEDNEGNYLLTNERYAAMLNSEGKQELSKHEIMETFTGNINVTFGNWLLNRDYFIGDIVTVQDNKINKYVNVRITEITEVQDENGYTIDAIYE